MATQYNSLMTDTDTHTARASRRPGKWLPLLALAVAALLSGVMAALWTGTSDTTAAVSGEANDTELAAIQSKLANTVLLPEDFLQVPGFSLLDGDGNEITEAVFEDTWSLVFFGFTHCPDVCPITLSVMNSVVHTLAKQNTIDPMQVVFVTVDPHRDTPDIVGSYVDYFNPAFIGITGSQGDIQAFTSSMGIVAAFTANDDDPENYSVDHTASMLMIDPHGRVRAKFNAPHEAETIVADYTVLLNALDEAPQN